MMKQPSLLHIGLGAFATAALLRAALPLVSDDLGGLFVGPAEAAGGAETAAAAETKAAGTGPGAGCEAPEALMQSIRDERDLLATQQDRAAERRAELELLEERLAGETSRLESLRADLSDLLARAEAAQTADVDRLVALYRNMKPDAAAMIMNDLDLEASIMVLATMPERDAAPIMARLNPVRARAISKIILERSQLPGDQDLDGIRIQ